MSFSYDNKNQTLEHINLDITKCEIDETINRLKGKNTEDVSVFHGRDLFAYCGARLASGIITYEEDSVTYPVDEIV